MLTGSELGRSGLQGRCAEGGWSSVSELPFGSVLSSMGDVMELTLAQMHLWVCVLAPLKVQELGLCWAEA